MAFRFFILKMTPELIEFTIWTGVCFHQCVSFLAAMGLSLRDCTCICGMHFDSSSSDQSRDSPTGLLDVRFKSEAGWRWFITAVFGVQGWPYWQMFDPNYPTSTCRLSLFLPSNVCNLWGHLRSGPSLTIILWSCCCSFNAKISKLFSMSSQKLLIRLCTISRCCQSGAI